MNIQFAPQPMTRQASPVRKVSRPDLTPEMLTSLAAMLYVCECAAIGDQPQPFVSLPEERQDGYRVRAKREVLSGIGWIDAKARSRAVRESVIAHDIYLEFKPEACRLIEETIDDALLNYGPALDYVAKKEMR